jgi:hypothetical protein
MPARFKIKYTGQVPALLLSEQRAQRTWNQMIREVWITRGELWHAEFRPKHFTKAGAREYGYHPRAGEPGNTRKNFWRSYTGRKQRVMHHTRPLIWSGESMNLTRIRVVQVQATKTKSRCEVVLRSPGFNRRNPHSDIDMREEVTHVSDAESREIMQGFDAEMDARLARLSETKTVVIR